MKKHLSFYLLLLILPAILLITACSDDNKTTTGVSASNIVVLITDYGDYGPWMGRLKGFVLEASANAKVIVGDSNVPAYDVMSGAFIIKNIYSAYPNGTIFVCVVEPSTSSATDAIVVDYKGRMFTAPDNGLLSYLLMDTTNVTGINKVETLGIDYGAPYSLSRDELFGTIGGLISRGWYLNDFGSAMDSANVLPIFETWLDGDTIITQAAFTDVFGNITTHAGIVDWGAAGIFVEDTLVVEYPGGQFKALAGESYSSVASGEEVAFINSLELIEIAINLGSLADVYGISVGDTLRVYKQ